MKNESNSKFTFYFSIFELLQLSMGKQAQQNCTTRYLVLKSNYQNTILLSTLSVSPKTRHEYSFLRHAHLS